MRSRARGGYLNLALWQRYLIAGMGAVVLLVAMVIFVSGHNTDSPPSSQLHQSANSIRQAKILVEQDQAPHPGHVSPAVAPGTGLARLLRHRIATEASRGVIDGPVKTSVCRATGYGSGSTRGFSCSIQSANVFYPFLGTVDTATGRVTFCKRDPPPQPGEDVPVSHSCRV
jgi:hypothetical protein